VVPKNTSNTGFAAGAVSRSAIQFVLSFGHFHAVRRPGPHRRSQPPRRRPISTTPRALATQDTASKAAQKQRPAYNPIPTHAADAWRDLRPFILSLANNVLFVTPAAVANCRRRSNFCI